ncbi:multicopper oxidase domain-containing protein [Luteococcus sp. Sow4_B9]|uniref:multicopper oxidase domain-containing protein n=1 Tax=Luteococcus sp. Sow4_B9 TaxID=3438792 RepID=UPI003F96CE89
MLTRRGWHSRAALPMLFWMVALVGLVLSHRWVPKATWLMVHLVTVGVASNAIVVWSNHFADAVLRTQPRGHRREIVALTLLNAGLVFLVGGVLAQSAWLLWPGVLGIALAAVAQLVGLAQQARASLPARFAVVVGWYRCAAACLVGGAILGGLMAAPFGGAADALLASHLVLNVLGWVGMTVWGTLVTLWPTMLRTRAAEGAGERARRTLPWVMVCIVAAAIAPALHTVAPHGWRIMGALALGWLLVILMDSCLSGLRTWRGRGTRSFAVLSVAAGQLWLLGWLAWAVWQWMAAANPAGLVAALRDGVVVLVVGFLLQTVLGALSHLVPVVLGGGPAMVRRTSAVFERGGIARLTVVNLGLVIFHLPITSVWKVTSSTAVFIALALFIGCLVRAWRVRRQAGAETAQPVASPNSLKRGLAWGMAWSVFAAAVAAGVDPVAFRAMAGRSAGPTSSIGAQATTEVRVVARDMRFIPDTIMVPAGNRLVVTLVNEDSGLVHDLILDNGVTSGRLGPGEQGVVDVGIIDAPTQGWCSVAGHRAMGMELTIETTGTATSHAQHQDNSTPTREGSFPSDGDADVPTPQLDLSTDYTQDWSPRDASLPPAPQGRLHRHTLRVTDEVVEVAPGVRQTLWLFNGQAPGPVLRGRVGDVFEITLVNDSGMGHGIDFHAGALAPDRPMRTIAPGERLVYRFTAGRAGIWLYHCSTAPMSQHIANGMYGAVVIDPPDLEPVDKEFLIIQSEQFFGAEEGGRPGVADMAKIQAEQPDAVVFNGHAGQYARHPLEARVGERVRFWVLDAGPSRALAFHIVGTQFDTVWFEGAWRLNRGRTPGSSGSDTGGSQTLGMLAAQGGFVETVFPEAGHYSMVNHQMVDAERGASGVVRVR